MSNRRQILEAALAITPAAFCAVPSVDAAGLSKSSAVLKPNSIAFSDLPRHFDVEPGIHNLEAGYWSIMRRIVAETYAQHCVAVNQCNSIFARGINQRVPSWHDANHAAQVAIARQVGCLPEEVAVTRSGADALQMLITNYRNLQPGDAGVRTAWIFDRRGAVVEGDHVPQTIEGAFAQGAKEMIVMLPDSKTLHNGSMYSSSVTTGDFEKFIAHDVVAYMDAHYRTLPERSSRGLIGHSMGGYGATRIGMKYPDVFGSLYVMSPCCLSPRPAPAPGSEVDKALQAVKAPEDSAKLPFMARAQLASASAWSSNPKNPPLYLDLPVKDGVVQPDVVAKWTANAPLAFVDQYISNLRRYRGIAFDVGDEDGLRTDTGRLHDALSQYDIANSLEVYKGTRTSAVAERFQAHVMPFFSEHLCFERRCK